MAKTSGLAIGSLVTGILGILIPFIGGLFAITAIVLGIISMKQIKKDPDLKGRGMAIAGLILGILSIVLIIVGFILIGSGLGGGLFGSTVTMGATPIQPA